MRGRSSRPVPRGGGEPVGGQRQLDGADGAFNGARVLQGTCVPISNEEFRTSAAPPVAMSIQARVGFRDTGFCIDVPDGSSQEGLGVQLFQCNGTLAQGFFHGFFTG